MQNFETKVSYVKIDNDGRERKVTETYLLDAVSYTDAETRIVAQMQELVRGEFAVKGIKESNVIEIFPSENGGWWYKAKISLVTIDERLGREKKINNYLLVEADDIKQALARLEEGLNYVLVPYEVTSIALTPICDVFPYFEDKPSSDEPNPTN